MVQSSRRAQATVPRIKTSVLIQCAEFAVPNNSVKTALLLLGGFVIYRPVVFVSNTHRWPETPV